jgi:RNA polymerase sigma-70 factor (ECF subfamily)
MEAPTKNQPAAQPVKEAVTSKAPLTPDLVCRAYGERVYNLARRMVQSDADAEDVTQDVLLQVVRKLPTFRGESALPTWLHQVTVNAALAHRRRRANRVSRRFSRLLDSSGGDEPFRNPLGRGSSRPDEVALDREKQRLIERAISRLPTVYRDVFIKADVEGLPNADIAEQIGLSVAAVKSRLHRARLLMRQHLAAHFEESETSGGR